MLFRSEDNAEGRLQVLLQAGRGCGGGLHWAWGSQGAVGFSGSPQPAAWPTPGFTCEQLLPGAPSSAPHEGGMPGALAPGQMGWLAGLDCLPPRVCSAKQKECRPQGSVTPAQSPGEQLEEADCQALDPSPAQPPHPLPLAYLSPPLLAPLASAPPCVQVFSLVSGRAPLSGCFPLSGCAPLSPGPPPCPQVCPLVPGRVPLCPGVSPCPGAPPCVWACPLVSGCAPLVQVFPLVWVCPLDLVPLCLFS